MFARDVTLLLMRLVDSKEEDEAGVEVIALVFVDNVVVVVVSVVNIEAYTGGEETVASPRVVEGVRPPFKHC